jgi:hypothetical protein
MAEALENQLMIEYAKSRRSTCKYCLDKIDMGELRIGLKSNFLVK